MYINVRMWKILVIGFTNISRTLLLPKFFLTARSAQPAGGHMGEAPGRRDPSKSRKFVEMSCDFLGISNDLQEIIGSEWIW